jgi:hypothetical protein
MAHAIDQELETVLRTRSFSEIKKYISDKESKVEHKFLLTGETGVLHKNRNLNDAEKQAIVDLLIPVHQPTEQSEELSRYPPPKTLPLTRDIRRGGGDEGDEGDEPFKSTKFSTVKITSKLRKYIKRCGYKLVKINKKSRVK